ncbi:MAG TPA: hypothetical protein DIU39_08025 [Flavobacteriales bacterium]|nr:hypothetical protein [Flavobacteriales bacterium]|tara:strand:- start:17846 stop:18796 length:951 start_codon:yes stop_codon:yes gene_type:complete
MKKVLTIILFEVFLYLNCIDVFGQVQIDTILPQKDAMIHEYINNVNKNYGDYPYFKTQEWTNGGVPYSIRSLIEFNLNNIPNDAIIDSAFLFLHGINHNPLTKPNASYLCRVLNPWDEHLVTWTTQPDYTMEDSVYIPSSTSSNQNYKVDITWHVQDMIINPESNFGFMFRLVNEVYYTRMQFASSDYSDSNLRPYVVVYYHYSTEYAKLQHELGMNFKNVDPLGRLKFFYRERYHEGTLDYEIIDENNNVILSSNTYSISKVYGDNWISIDLQCKAIPLNKFYVLIVKDDKGRKQFLRFLYAPIWLSNCGTPQPY